jgi:hypothetical protein
MYGHTGNNWDHRNNSNSFREKYGSHTRKTASRFTTKAAKLGTSHIIRKVLQSETESLRGGDRRCFRKSTREKRLVIGDNLIIIIICRITNAYNRD